MALIGLDDVNYAKLIKDDSTGVTYSTTTAIPGGITVDYQAQNNSNTLYADNSPYAVANAFGGAKVSIELASLPLNIRADLLGHTIKNGVMEAKADDEAPYVALMYKSVKHNGEFRYVKLLKGKFTEPQETSKTKTDSPEFETPKMEGNFVSRVYDKKWVYVADTDDKTFTSAMKANWFKSVDSQD